MSYAAPASRGYLDARVTTASQPELQIMLIDGAMRFGRQVLETSNDVEKSFQTDEALRRVVDIVEELVRSATLGEAAESRRLQEEYAFILRQVALCVLDFDAARLESALKLLAYQRETWKLACEKLRQDAPQGTHSSTEVQFAASAPKPHSRTISTPMPHLGHDAPTGGFSFTA
jgi:flagellar secretion chaperone FliS